MEIELNDFKKAVYRIKSNLARNKLKTAVNETLLLMQSLRNEELESSAIIISAVFHDVKDKKTIGVIDLNDNTATNKLIKSIIGLLYLAEDFINEQLNNELCMQELRLDSG